MPQTDPDTLSGDAVEEVFLSPRVVDAGAFADFAGRLREVVRQADAAGRSLHGVVGEAREVLDSLKGEQSGSRTRLEAFSKVLATLDERAKRLEGLVEAAESRAASLPDIERKVGALVESALAKIAARAEEAAGGLDARLNSVSTEAATRLGQIRAQAERSVQELRHEMARSAADTEARLERRAAELSETLSASSEQERQRLEKTRAELLDVIRLSTKVSETTDQLETRLRVIGEDAERVSSAAAERLRDICAQAKDLLGLDPATGQTRGDAPGSLAGLVERAERERHAAQQAAGELAGANTDARSAKRDLEGCVSTAGAWLLTLEKKRAELREQSAQAQRRADESRRELERVEQSLRGLVRGPADEVQREAERVAGLLESVRTARGEAEQLLARYERLRERAAEEIQVLAEQPPADADAPAPAGAAADAPSPDELLGAVRRESSSELSKMTEAIRALAERAADGKAAGSIEVKPVRGRVSTRSAPQNGAANGPKVSRQKRSSK
jgi:chromosome segregation ATPase